MNKTVSREKKASILRTKEVVERDVWDARKEKDEEKI